MPLPYYLSVNTPFSQGGIGYATGDIIAGDAAIPQILLGPNASSVSLLDSPGGYGFPPWGGLPGTIIGRLANRGSWNASLNSPTLIPGIGRPGDTYTVGTAGTMSLDSPGPWLVGDWVIFGGQRWVKVSPTIFFTGQGNPFGP